MTINAAAQAVPPAIKTPWVAAGLSAVSLVVASLYLLGWTVAAFLLLTAGPEESTGYATIGPTAGEVVLAIAQHFIVPVIAIGAAINAIRQTIGGRARSAWLSCVLAVAAAEICVL